MGAAHFVGFWFLFGFDAFGEGVRWGLELVDEGGREVLDVELGGGYGKGCMAVGAGDADLVRGVGES